MRNSLRLGGRKSRRVTSVNACGVTKTASTDARAAVRIRSDVENNISGPVGVSRNATNSLQVIQSKIVSHSPCNEMIRERGVAAQSHGADQFLARRIQTEPATEHIHAAHFFTNTRIVRLAEVSRGSLYAAAVSTGLLNCKPKRLPPG
jgi:hypothetical protein